jgi:cytochrome c551/c552
MRNAFCRYKTALLALTALPLCALALPLTIHLPAETVRLRPSSLAGYAVAQQKCGICHSADYIEYQPPGFNRDQWTGLARKMQEAYGAPLSDSEITVVGEYLAATYSGTARPSVETPNNTTAQASNTIDLPVVADVQTLLNQNACLGCHAIDRKVVGPAYHDVAMRYKGDAQATLQVIDHIRLGGAGRWGNITMPPFPDLQPAQLEQLADFILAQ